MDLPHSITLSKTFQFRLSHTYNLLINISDNESYNMLNIKCPHYFTFSINCIFNTPKHLRNANYQLPKLYNCIKAKKEKIEIS